LRDPAAPRVSCREAHNDSQPRPAVVPLRSDPSRSGLPIDAGLAHSCLDRHQISPEHYGSSVRHSAERATEARKEADRLACIAWNQRMLDFKGPAQPSPSLGDALNARYLYLEVCCLGCNTHQTVRSTSSADRRRRQSTNWSVTCGARTARRFGAIRSSGAILWRSGRRRSRPSIHLRPGGRERGKSKPAIPLTGMQHRGSIFRLSE
jgi:hypothetical protein